MPKALIQFTALAALFFGTWLMLSRLDFVELFHVKQITEENERRLGTFILDAVRRDHQEFESDTVRRTIETIKHRLCAANAVTDSSITLHILAQDDVNAFALPGRHLVLTTGLIFYCKTPEELAGVLAHEIAHMELHHVMEKLVKEVGLTMLTAIAGGESSGEIGRKTARLLSSTAFDRGQETEADTWAVHMMAKADIDPESLADFLFRLSQEKNDIPKSFEWLSTHPNSQDRSAEILKIRKMETVSPRSLMENETWECVRGVSGASHSP